MPCPPLLGTCREADIEKNIFLVPTLGGNPLSVRWVVSRGHACSETGWWEPTASSWDAEREI